MAKPEPKAKWPFPEPGAAQPAPEMAAATHEGKGGSYLLDDATGERTLIERTQQPEGCTRHLAPQSKE